MIYKFKDIEVDAIHCCSHSFSGCVHLHEQAIWAYSGSDVLFSRVLIPCIKYCPHCGAELESERLEEWERLGLREAE